MKINANTERLGEEFYEMLFSIDLANTPFPEEDVCSEDKVLGTVKDKMILRAHILIQKLNFEMEKSIRNAPEKIAKIQAFMCDCADIFWKYVLREFPHVDGLKGNNTLCFRKGWVLVAVKKETAKPKVLQNDTYLNPN